MAAFGRLPDIQSEHDHPEPRPGVTSERVLVGDLAKDRKTLGEIRAAVDKKFRFR